MALMLPPARAARAAAPPQLHWRSSARAGGAGLALTALIYLISRKVTDLDTWWHLAAGRLVWTRGTLPATDPFTWRAAGQPWSQEWLGNLVLWGVYQVGGVSATVGLAAALTAATILGAYRLGRLRGGSPAASAILATLSALYLLQANSARPQVFTWALLVGLSLGLEGIIRRDQGWASLIGLIPLGWLWAGLHGAYLLGPLLVIGYGILLGTGAGLGWQGPGRGWEAQSTPNAYWRRRAFQLLGAGLLMWAAAALPPQGPSWWLYPLAGASSPSVNAYIADWQSPDFHGATGVPVIWFLAGLLVLGPMTALALSTPERAGWRARWIHQLTATGRDWPALIGWGVAGATLLAGLYQQRHLALFFGLGPSILAPWLDAWLVDLGAQFTRRGRRIGIGVLAGAGGLLFGVALVPPLLQGGPTALAAGGGDAGYYPVAALANPQVRALLTDPRQRLWNSQQWGGYLLWQGVAVGMDSRHFVYGEDGIRRYLEVLLLRADWQTELESEGIQLVLVPTGSSLAAALDGRPTWPVAYQDPVATLYQYQPAGPAGSDPPAAGVGAREQQP